MVMIAVRPWTKVTLTFSYDAASPLNKNDRSAGYRFRAQPLHETISAVTLGAVTTGTNNDIGRDAASGAAAMATFTNGDKNVHHKITRI